MCGYSVGFCSFLPTLCDVSLLVSSPTYEDTTDDQTQDQYQDDDWNNGPSSNSGPTFPFGQGDDSTVEDDSVQDDDADDDDWSNPSAPTDNSAREQDDDDDDNWSNPSAETEADDDDGECPLALE